MIRTIPHPLSNEPFFKFILGKIPSKVLLFLSIQVVFFGVTFFLSYTEHLYTGKKYKISFLDDFSTVMAFIILNPLIILFFIKFFDQIVNLLNKLEIDQRINLKDPTLEKIVNRISNLFTQKAINYSSFIISLIIMIFQVIDTLKYQGYFAVGENHFLSYPGFYMLFISWMCMWFYVNCIIRATICIYFLRKVFQAGVRVDFLHEDQCGGLAETGRVSMTFNIILFFFAIIMLLFAYSDTMVFHNPFSFRVLLGFSAYFILAPILFVAPLNPIHNAMKKSKQIYLERVRIAINNTFQQLEIHSKDLTDPGVLSQTESLYKLLDFYSYIDKMPVWPINPKLVTKLTATMGIPLIAFIIQMVSNADSIIYNFDKLKSLFGM